MQKGQVPTRAMCVRACYVRAQAYVCVARASMPMKIRYRWRKSPQWQSKTTYLHHKLMIGTIQIIVHILKTQNTKN